MRRYPIFRSLLAASLAMTPKSFADALIHYVERPIAVANAEDLVAVDNARWVIASIMASDDVQSALYAIGKSSPHQAIQIYPAQNGSNETTLQGSRARNPGDCDTEPRTGEYSGHGIAFRATAAESGTLFVVNHGRGETIEIFSVTGLRSRLTAPRVAWRGCIALPPGTVGNAVTATPDERVYATITPVENGIPQLASVSYWTPDLGWTVLAGSDVRIPTGISSTPDGRKIYVSSFVDRNIREISVDGQGTTQRQVDVPFGPDNLSWARDDTLLVGGLEGSPAVVMSSCRASSDPRCAFPGFVAQIDPRSFKLTCAVHLGSTTTTTATAVNNMLWFGSSRSLSIWRARRSLLTRCPSRIDVRSGLRP